MGEGRYQLFVTSRAQDELAEEWLSHPNLRDAIATSWSRIERDLRFDPQAKGERIKNAPGYFRLRVQPLTVYFEVFPDDRKVNILKVTT
jgi:hypothetical protein